MSTVVSVIVGGAIGALSRYGVDRVIEQRSDSSFPWSTFVINVTGCVLVGFLIAAIVDRHSAPEWLRADLVVGVCGLHDVLHIRAGDPRPDRGARHGVRSAERLRERRSRRARSHARCTPRATRVTRRRTS